MELLRSISETIVALLIIYTSKVSTTDQTTAFPQIHYSCDGTEVALLQTNLTNIHILVDEAKSQYCKPKNESLSNCRKANEKLPHPLKVIYEEELKPNVVGGKSVYFYELNCLNRNISIEANVSLTANHMTDQTRIKNTTEDMFLSLTISRKTNGPKLTGSVTIGEVLYLTLKGPAHHIVNPLKCSAMANKEAVQMWSNTNKCEHDSALIDKAWIGNNRTISITMYAFRFISSNKIKITCTAMVCPEKGENNCQQTKVCVNANPTVRPTNVGRRRRNSILNSKSDIRSATASFHVVSNDISNQANGHKSFTAATMFIVLSTSMIFM